MKRDTSTTVLTGGSNQSLLQKTQLPFVLGMYALRHVLEGAHGLLSRLPLREAKVRELEERYRGCDALRRPRPKELLRFVEGDQRRELAVEANSA